jgi:hypothetical protein
MISFKNQSLGVFSVNMYTQWRGDTVNREVAASQFFGGLGGYRELPLKLVEFTMPLCIRVDVTDRACTKSTSRVYTRDERERARERERERERVSPSVPARK